MLPSTGASQEHLAHSQLMPPDMGFLFSALEGRVHGQNSLSYGCFLWAAMCSTWSIRAPRAHDDDAADEDDDDDGGDDGDAN